MADSTAVNSASTYVVGTDPWRISFDDALYTPSLHTHSSLPLPAVTQLLQESGGKAVIPLRPERLSQHEVITQLVTERKIDNQLDLKQKFTRIIESAEYKALDHAGLGEVEKQNALRRILDSQGLEKIPHLDAANRKNAFIMGGPGTGKSRLFKTLLHDRPADFANATYVNPDDYRPLLASYEEHGPLWASVTKDETGHLKTKIVSRLQSMADAGKAPNVIFDTAFPSEDMMNFGKGASANLTYIGSAPMEVTTQRALDRGHQQGRFIPTYVVLDGAKKSAQRTPGMLELPGAEFELVSTNVPENAPQKTIAFYDPQNKKIIVREPDLFIDYIERSKMQANAHGPDELYRDAYKNPKSIAGHLKVYTEQGITIEFQDSEQRTAAVLSKENGFQISDKSKLATAQRGEAFYTGLEKECSLGNQKTGSPPLTVKTAQASEQAKTPTPATPSIAEQKEKIRLAVDEARGKILPPTSLDGVDGITVGEKSVSFRGKEILTKGADGKYVATSKPDYLAALTESEGLRNYAFTDAAGEFHQVAKGQALGAVNTSLTRSLAETATTAKPAEQPTQVAAKEPIPAPVAPEEKTPVTTAPEPHAANPAVAAPEHAPVTTVPDEKPATIPARTAVAPRAPLFPAFASSMGARYSATGALAGGTVFSGVALYHQLKPGGTLEQDMNSGNSTQASLSQASTVLNATAFGLGVTSLATDGAAMLEKGLAGSSNAATKLFLPVALAATATEVAVANAAVDGHRATRAVGGLVGAGALGTIGFQAGGYFAGPPGAVIGSTTFGLAGAFGAGELANTAAGDYVQNKFENWNQEKVDALLAKGVDLSGKPVPQLKPNERIEEFQNKILEARQHLVDVFNQQGLDSVSGIMAVSQARTNLIKIQLEINKEWFKDMEKNSYELATTYAPLLSTARAAGLKADAEAGRKVFSTGEAELERQLNVQNLETVHDRLSGEVTRATAAAKELSSFAMYTNESTNSLDDQIKMLAKAKSYGSDISAYEKQLLSDLGNGKPVHMQSMDPRLRVMPGVDPSLLNNTQIQLADLLNPPDPKLSEAAAKAHAQGIGLQGKAASDGKQYIDGQPEAVPQTKATDPIEKPAPAAGRG